MLIVPISMVPEPWLYTILSDSGLSVVGFCWSLLFFRSRSILREVLPEIVKSLKVSVFKPEDDSSGWWRLIVTLLKSALSEEFPKFCVFSPREKLPSLTERLFPVPVAPKSAKELSNTKSAFS